MKKIEFRECPACAAKPGSPTLCESCLHNRKAIEILRATVKHEMTLHLDIPEHDQYSELQHVLGRALSQSRDGKGKERHAQQGEPFKQQPICEIGRRLGSSDYEIGQAIKKAYESKRLIDLKGPEAAVAELLGAINYLAAAVILIEERSKKDDATE